jgi:hypothetical protein
VSLLCADALSDAFDTFDHGGKGYLTFDELRALMNGYAAVFESDFPTRPRSRVYARVVVPVITVVAFSLVTAASAPVSVGDQLSVLGVSSLVRGSGFESFSLTFLSCRYLCMMSYRLSGTFIEAMRRGVVAALIADGKDPAQIKQSLQKWWVQ